MRKRRGTLIAAALVCLLAMSGCGRNGQSDVQSTRTEGLDKLGSIQVIAREDGSGTRNAFAELAGFLESSKDQSDLTTEKAQIANNAREVQELVGQNASAIGYLSLGAVENDEKIKLLKVNGADASLDEKTYPLSRTFYLAYSGKPNDLEQDFLTYVHGAGQAIVEESYIPVAKSSVFLSNREAGTIKIGGSSSAAPLLERLAESYMELNPNAKITVEVSDSADGLTGAMTGKYDLGMSSRDLKDYEKELLDYEAIARDDIAVIVNAQNPLNDITVEKLKEIFTGTLGEWEELND